MTFHGVYKHKKSGNLYVYICTAKYEATREDMVVYKSIEGNITWVRPATEFDEKFEVYSV